MRKSTATLDDVSREPLRMRLVAIILRWRLLIVAGVALVALLNEVSEANDLPGPFEPRLLIEYDVFVLGILFPLLVWALLALVARVLDQRVHNEEFLRRYRQFSQQLARCSGWEEVVNYVTSFPATLMPGTEAALYLYDRQLERFVFCQRSEPDGHMPAHGQLGDCGACPLAEKPNVETNGRIAPCRPTLDQGQNPFCLALSYENDLVGRLRLNLPQKRRMPPEVASFLEAASAEMALALVLAQANTARLEQTMLAAQRSERRQIAYALHDSLAQQVGYLHLNLDRLSADSAAPVNGDMRAELGQMREVAADIYEQIRGTLAILRSSDGLELKVAVEQLARSITADGGPEIDFQIEGEAQEVPADLTQRTVSILRECLHNVVKHAAAQRVEIRLQYCPDRFQIHVVDDGRGFEPYAASSAGHYGLSMMAEQIRDLRGQLEILSTLGQGTQIYITLPIRPIVHVPPDRSWTITARSDERVY